MINIRFYRNGIQYTVGCYETESNAHLNARKFDKYELVQWGKVIFSNL